MTLYILKPSVFWKICRRGVPFWGSSDGLDPALKLCFDSVQVLLAAVERERFFGQEGSKYKILVSF